MSALASLRLTSHSCHREVEASPFARALARGDLRLDQYACLLAAMHRLHETVEERLAVSVDPRVALVRPVLQPRAPRLLADLRALDRHAGPLDLSPAVRAWSLRPDALLVGLDGPMLLGALYTLEGSALGGQVILPRLRASLALPDEAFGYYIGHGPDTRRRFGELCERLERALDEPAALDAAGLGARWAFGVVHALFVALGASIEQPHDEVRAAS